MLADDYHFLELTRLVDMFELWNLVEEDLLSETIPYRLRDTGQGAVTEIRVLSF
jgi:hypothetical protein